MLTGILPAMIVLVTMFTVGLSSVWIVRRKQRGRRSPLTQQLLRNPGESLRQQIDQLSDKVTDCLIATMVVPLVVCITFLLQIQANPRVTWLVLVTYIAFGLLFAAYMIRRMVGIFDERNNYRLGLDAELAVGQELNQLMANGCRVFHDFPAEKFNIDHVVVGPGGVHAVETKGRAKPDKGRGAADANVKYDGKRLKFPDWQETAPLEQAKRQAVWLGKWLSSAVGSPVSVNPVLVLPGWYVERTGAGDVTIFNGKKPNFLSKPSGRATLDEKQIQQIAHQLEHRCRDIEPAAYRKD